MRCLSIEGGCSDLLQTMILLKLRIFTKLKVNRSSLIQIKVKNDTRQRNSVESFLT